MNRMSEIIILYEETSQFSYTCNTKVGFGISTHRSYPHSLHTESESTLYITLLVAYKYTLPWFEIVCLDKWGDKSDCRLTTGTHIRLEVWTDAYAIKLHSESFLQSPIKFLGLRESVHASTDP